MMGKTLRFIGLYFGQMLGIIAIAVPVILAGCFLFGQDSFFGSYLYLWPGMSLMFLGILFMQVPGAYGQIALSFGVTRRALQGATAALWVLSPAAYTALGQLGQAATVYFFPAQGDSILVRITTLPVYLWFCLGLGACGISLAAATLPNHGWGMFFKIILSVVTMLCLLGGAFMLSLLPRYIPVSAIISVVSGIVGLIFCLWKMRTAPVQV